MVKNTEATKLLESLDVQQLSVLHKFRGDESFKDLVSLFNHIITFDKEKSVGLFRDIKDNNTALEITSKGNFYRGRINMVVLVHALFKNAEFELEKRERKSV